MAIDLLSAALRALGLIALFQAAGGSIVTRLFRPHLDGVIDTVRRVTFLASIAAALLFLLGYSLESARMAGEWSGMLDFELQSLAAQSSTAVALAWRLAGIVLLALGARGRSTRGDTLAAIGAVAALGAFTLTGHTSASPLRPWPGVLLMLHVLIAAFWFGILLPLGLQTRNDASQAGVLATAFSALAVWLVPFIFVLGIVMAILLMKDVSGWRSTYALLLIGKAGGFALLMAFAALNKQRLAPGISSGDPGSPRMLRFSLAAEFALIAAVLAITAFLTTFHSPEG